MMKSTDQPAKFAIRSFLAMIAALASVALFAKSAPRPIGRVKAGQGSPQLSQAIQVRLDAATLTILEGIENHAKERTLKGFNRSAMIRNAVQAYIKPLVALLDREGALDPSTEVRITEIPEGIYQFGETTRVRLGDDLVKQLDQIEAYARGLGYRSVTRSSLIRKGVTAYLEGFRSELSNENSTTGGKRHGDAATHE